MDEILVAYLKQSPMLGLMAFILYRLYIDKKALEGIVMSLTREVVKAVESNQASSRELTKAVENNTAIIAQIYNAEHMPDHRAAYSNTQRIQPVPRASGD